MRRFSIALVSIALAALLIAASSPARAEYPDRAIQIAPDIATLDESGLPGFSITAWIGVVVPKGTPNAIVQKLNLEIGRALEDPEFARQISTIGIDPLGSTPDEFAAFLRKEIPRWKQIVQDAGVKLEGDH
jgi:tripartite-type tricarboxylate transporter receptor subunit TctC